MLVPRLYRLNVLPVLTIYLPARKTRRTPWRAPSQAARDMKTNPKILELKCAPKTSPSCRDGPCSIFLLSLLAVLCECLSLPSVTTGWFARQGSENKF